MSINNNIGMMLHGTPLPINSSANNMDKLVSMANGILSLVPTQTAIPLAIWSPSDPTGVSDMTTELENFVSQNQGYTVRVKEGSRILLKNAFQNVTTGNVFIDFGETTILYSNNTSSDAAIYLDNTGNASGERNVANVSMVTVNNDAFVSQLSIDTTVGANRFDWIALYGTDANPAKSGGQLGEIFQLITDEASLNLTATRKLNKYDFYTTTNLKIRKLSKVRSVHIKGGTFTANGNTESHSITARCKGIVVQGFVDPIIENVTFEKPWAQCIQFICCAAPKWQNITVKNVGNLATYNGFIYGVQLYGMNDNADGRNIVVRNGRHSGFTTDGNSSNTTTWHQKGIPTNFVVSGVHGFNCHASVVDTHEEGDGGYVTNVSGYNSYQDEDISPNFSGIVAQIRCSNMRFNNIHCYGGTGAIKVNAVDHGFEDQVHLDNIFTYNLTSSANTDIAINVADQSTITNKRMVYLFNSIFNNVSKCVFLGRTAKMTCGGIQAIRCGTWLDANEGSIFVATGPVALDFRNDTKAATLHANIIRSSLANGGATVIYMQKPLLIKGSSNTSPLSFFEEQDKTTSKIVWAPGLTEYNPSSANSTQFFKSGANTFTWATFTDPTNRSVRVHTANGNASLVDTDDVLVINKTFPAATTVNMSSPGIQNRKYNIKDGRGDAGSNNITLIPASGTIDGAATKVISSNYASINLIDNGTEWNIIDNYTGTTPVSLSTAPFLVVFNARADSTTSLTSMAATDQFFPVNSKRMVQLVDLTGYNQCRLIVNVVTGGTPSGKLVARYKTPFSYSTDLANTFIDLGVSEVACNVNTANVVASSWINLAANAKADVYLAVVQTNGDGVSTPGVGIVTIEIK